MAEQITPFPKERQVRRHGKPDLAAAVAEVEAKPQETTDQPTPVGKKRAARPAAMTDDIVGQPAFVGTAVELSLDRIEEMRNPRILASEAEQKTLNESVKQHGVLQPILVRPLDATGTKFAIVAGHRRLLAARTAHLSTIPAVVKVVDETNAFVQSLVENLQREDLNPLDEAKALQQLLAETGFTQDELGKKLGRRQSAISNSLRLLTLAEPVKAAIEDGTLSASHGKALAGLPTDQQEQVAAAAVAQKMPSRDVEDRIRKAKEDTKRNEENRVRKEAEAIKATTVVTAWLAEHADVTPETVTVIVGGYGNTHVTEALTGAGVQARPERHGDRQKPDYACDEQVTTLTYNDWKGSLVPTCTVETHHADFVKIRDHEKNEKAKEAGKKLERTKNAAMKAIRADDGKGTLNIDGQRLVLYQLLLSSRGYGGRSGNAEAFVKRHGGPANEVKTILTMDVVEAIEGLSEKDLGQELASAAISGVFVNLWGDSAASHAASEDWALRSLLVTKFGLDEDVVWGEASIPFQVVDAKNARGLPLTPEEKAEFDRVTAEREQWKSRWDGPKTADASADVGDDDDGDSAGDADQDGAYASLADVESAPDDDPEHPDDVASPGQVDAGLVEAADAEA